MGVGSEESRGVLKFLKPRERKRPKAVSFELDKLMIWVPATLCHRHYQGRGRPRPPVLLQVTGSREEAQTRLPDRRFSYYSVNVKNKFLTLNPMQEQFAAIGSYFKIGALPPAVAQIFIRSVPTKTEIRLGILISVSTLIVVVCCFCAVFSAWMRTAFLAGGNAVVRSGF